MSELPKHPGESSNDDLSPEGKAAAHSRRTFLFKLSVLLNAAVGTVLAAPILAYLLAPAMKKSSSVGAWIAIGSVSDVPAGETRLSPLDDQVLGAVIMWVFGSLVLLVPAMLIALELAGLGGEMQSRKDLPVRSDNRNPAL